MELAMPEKKNHDALRTIGEVAGDVGVATHVLRFWESQFTQITPQKRRGRRYYRIEDIATIKTIKELLYDNGYTIKGVHKFLKDAKNSASNQTSPTPDEIELKEVNENNLKRDLFGNIIADSDSEEASIPKFGVSEIAKLKQIYKGLCSSRNKLNDLA